MLSSYAIKPNRGYESVILNFEIYCYFMIDAERGPLDFKRPTDGWPPYAYSVPVMRISSLLIFNILSLI